MDWISVKDRMPEESVPVLGFNGISIILVKNLSGDWFESSWAHGNSLLWDYQISHWMPLPAPPKKS